MDFEWQTSAPADTTSPFYQLAQKHRKNDDGGKHGVKRTSSCLVQSTAWTVGCGLYTDGSLR